MMQRILILFGLFALALSGPAYAARTQGPLMTPLKVEKIYLTDSTAVYVSFQGGSMPDCYANRGGYLWKTNPNFDQIYAQLLTIVAANGIRGHVIFDTINPGAGSWSDCNLIGIHLVPQ